MAILTQPQLERIASQIGTLDGTLDELKLLVDAGNKSPEDYLNLSHALEDELSTIINELEEL